MDPTQKEKLDGAMPTGGGVDSGVPSGVGVLSGVGAQPGMPMNAGQPMGSIVSGQSMMPGGAEMNNGMGNYGVANSGMANSGFGNVGMPMGSGMGDVVLNNGGEKKSKKWLIVGGVVGMIIVVTVVIVLVMISISGNGGMIGLGESKSYKEKWEEYYNLLMYGGENNTGLKDGESLSVDNWFPERIDKVGHGEMEYSEFYQGYYDRLKESLSSLSGDNRSSEVTDEYIDMGYTFIDYNLLSQLEEKVYDEYKKGGFEKASNYLSDLYVDNNNENRSTAVFKLYLKEYLVARLKMIELYDKNDCYEDDLLLEPCVHELMESGIASSVTENEARWRNNLVVYYNDSYEDLFFSRTEATNKTLETKG